MALAGQGKTKAMVGYLDIETTGNQSLAAIVPSAIEGKFLYWWLTSQYRHIRNLSSQDGRDGLNLEMLGSIRCPVPSPEAQKRISAFLDEKTAQIDGLIMKKRALLERLAEKRQAIITQAVTKGLNPAAPMKNSGIDWLGQIPSHWEVKPLKRLASIWGRIGFRGYTVNDIVSEGEGALSLSPSNIVGDRISFDTKTHISWEKYHESPEIKVQVGDILFVKTGSTIGKVCLVTESPEPMTVNPQVVVLKVHAANSLFLSAAMSSAYFNYQVKGCIFGGSTPAMTQYNLGSLAVAVPSEVEQKNIAAHIARSEDEHLNAKRQVERSVKLLAEYRSALITAAVTGQIEGLK
jgi:type I restriction enzyme S subunit